MKAKPLVSVVIPLFNGAATIKTALLSLIGQKGVNYKLIVVNNGSTDRSLRIVHRVLGRYRLKADLLNFKHPLGLANAYNAGIKRELGEFVVTMHQDMRLKSFTELKKLVSPLILDKTVVVSCHSAEIPFKIWETYGFWQKVFFDRGAGVVLSGANGKFDGFRKEALMKVGLFDGQTFHSAGEDEDAMRKLKKIGRIVLSRAETEHLHGFEPSFGVGAIFRKHAQYAEAYGAVTQRYGLPGPGISRTIITFHREILLLSLTVPFVQYLGVIIIIFYAFFYTRHVYLSQWKNPRILLVPFVNFSLLFVSFGYSLKGFITGKQQL